MENMGFYQNFCGNVAYLREHYGLTEKEIATVLGVSVRTFRGIEAGEPGHRVGTLMLCRLCDRFDLSIDAVLGTRLDMSKTE